MIYPDNFEQKIGFDQIRRMLQELCLSTLGRDLIDDMSFMTDYDAILTALHRTDEMIKIERSDEEFPTDFFYDVRPMLKRIRIEGTFIDVSELFDLRRSLETIRRVVSFFKTKEDEQPLYPYLSDMSGDVLVYPQLTKEIDSILDKTGGIRDNASPELLAIRRNLSATMAGISRSLNNILRHAQSEGYVDKDVAPTVRDGRLVIPVIPTFKRKIRGIVHDESASGKTVYIEPAEVVEANNHIRELEIEERREIVRILTAFTDTLRPHAQEIASSYDFMAEIDFIRAKALLSIDINATLPHIERECQIDWYHAIHPLLLLALRRQNKEVVPLNITLDSHNRILLISGPNAGGKSVCLKTVGLLQYMMQCGVPVPMYDNSHMGIFENIFIDIGDEQSIEDDLSTYSSHLSHMKQCVRHCNERSLLLIDEFGGGTEPQIGGAIAEALLDRFNQRKAFGVITTHYQNLKHYAEDADGVVNGAMLYDRHHMQPLFTLSIGNPGSSFAIEIARKIGLPEDIIADASAKVGSDYISMDKYLQDIVRDKRYWENKRQNIRQKEKQLEELTARYSENLNRLDRERKEWLAKAKDEARALLSDTNTRIESTIKEIREAQADKERTKEARRRLDEWKNQVVAEESATTEEDKIQREIRKLKERELRKQQKRKEQPATPQQQPELTIAIGDAVRIKGQNTVGEVTALNDKEATVVFGMVQSKIKRNRLEKVGRNQLKRESNRKATFISASTTDDMREKQLTFTNEIDVRGMRVDEAIQAITYFIDDAIQVSCSRVRILHGTGTGALRASIRQYLKSVHGVRHFADEHIQLGGAGITVVDLE
ncbi:MAG: Smr/MutS family protein [Bacteroidaceae bacterium]|nr:Smr/MutS family protein [Bacteroidaceae bacterium]